MKRPNFSRTFRAQAGFTLVEMLVVITIIGILAALTIPAVNAVVGTAKDSAITMQLSQLEMACQMYKEKFGEYPPDFTANSHNAVLAHLAAAFPRYQPGQPSGGAHTGWQGLQDDVKNGWNIDIDRLDSRGAVAFWLCGQPDWLTDASGDATLQDGSTKVMANKPVKGFFGFSADPTNPFADAATSASRVSPFYEGVDLACLRFDATCGIMLWPSKACDKTKNCPIVIFRASNGNYLCEDGTTTIKSCGAVRPAIDMTLSKLTDTPSSTLTWVNPKSMQIFSAGRDATYSTLNSITLNGYSDNVLEYPSGENYGINTFDDITNFSGGKLENKIP